MGDVSRTRRSSTPRTDENFDKICERKSFHKTFCRNKRILGRKCALSFWIENNKMFLLVMKVGCLTQKPNARARKWQASGYPNLKKAS